MSAAALVAALALPSEARVDRRVPRKLLLEHGAPGAADRRLVQDGLEELVWVAALKPATVGVPAYSDGAREYLEIAVVAARLRAAAKAARMMELIHRAIPYPLVLLATSDEGTALSLAHKRRSEAEAERVVVEAVESTPPLRLDAPEEADFLSSLPLASQPGTDLYALYEGWRGCVTALAAARVTGRYTAATSQERTAARRAALDEYERTRREIDRLRALAEKEKQVNRLVDLNSEIRRLEARIAQLHAEL